MKSILLVEDDKILREVIKYSLEVNNYNVIEATNGKMAKELISEQNFDTIISDIQMPKVNGVQLLQWAKDVRPETPFILMTGFSDLANKKSALAIGAHEFLAKPFSNKELLGAVNRSLDYKKAS